MKCSIDRRMRESEERKKNVQNSVFTDVLWAIILSAEVLIDVCLFFSNEKKMHVHSILQIEIQSLMLDAAALGPTLTGYEALLRWLEQCSEVIAVFTQ